MGKVDVLYKQLLYAIQEKGFEYQDVRRSSVKRKQISSLVLDIPMSEGFPLLTLKAMPFKMIVSEFLWFIKGQTNIYWLHSSNNHIWDKDAYNFYIKQYKQVYPSSLQNQLTFTEFVDTINQADGVKALNNFQYLGTNYSLGDVGKNYSHQWTNWGGNSRNRGRGENQLFNLVRNLRQNPMDSRHIVTGWNPSELTKTALPPCHWSFEVLVSPIPKWQQEEEGLPEYRFSLKWHQRSVDTFLGLPFNIASYALLGIFIQSITGIHFSSLIGDLSNVHIYSNHYDAVKKLEPLVPTVYGSPEITLSTEAKSFLNSIVVTLNSDKATLKDKREDFESLVSKLSVTDFQLHHYQSFEKIQADMIAPDKI